MNKLKEIAIDNAPLQKFLDATASAFWHKTAVITTNDAATYGQIFERSNQLANWLLEHNAGKGDIIGLMIDRSVEMVIAMIAVLKAGMAYLPVDPEYPSDRIDYILTNASAKMLLLSDKYLSDELSGYNPQVIEEAMTESLLLPADAIDMDIAGTDLAYILYTSGSTGQPKGVQITHANLVNLLLSIREEPGITADDRLLAVSTISFDIAELEVYLPLIAGATVYIAPAGTGRDGKKLLNLIREEQITIMQATPFSWKIMLESGWKEHLELKAFCGGEPLAKDLAMRIVPKCKELWNMYGPTETTIYSTIKHISADDEVITIGRPIANTQIYIVNEDLELLPDGEAGEIVIGGDGVSPGYFNRPELTAEKFIDNKFDEDNGKVYRTGDLGKVLPDGELQHLGRIDRQVKIRGFRIETQEIEYQLRGTENIADAVVDVRPDATGNPALAAYIIPEKYPDDIRIEIQKWRAALRDKLPEYMVPQFFMMIEELPLTPNGKTDYKALPQPDHTAIALMPYTPPRTDVEKKLVDIWERYLGIDKVGIFDDFFDLGGHSLIAVQIMNDIQLELHKTLPLASLFQHSTIEKLALLMRLNGKSITWDSLVPIKPTGSKTPLYIVHGAGMHVLLFNTLAVNLDPDQPVFGLQAKGLNGIDEPYYTIEDMAAHYVKEIVANNPKGPYALAGYSLGGLIAYEMARQMQKMGKHVTTLAMFDTNVEVEKPTPKTNLGRFWGQAKHVAVQAGYIVKLMTKYPLSTIKHKSRAVRRRLMSMYWRVKYGKSQNQQGFFGYAHKIDVINADAERNYVVKPANVHIDLFKAKKVMFYMDDFEYLGWKPYALNGITIHDIPGDHDSIFTPPNDRVFAQLLQQCLDSASQPNKKAA